jgi:hypothetical protein
MLNEFFVPAFKEGKTFPNYIYKSYKSLDKFNIRSQLNIIFISSEVKGFFFTSKSNIISIGYKYNVLIELPDSVFQRQYILLISPLRQDPCQSALRAEQI